MELKSEPKKKFVEDYDFMLKGGIVKFVTLDTSAGDNIEYVTGGIKIHLAARPGLVDPLEIVPAEEITIFSQHVLYIEHRERLVEEKTPDQLFEFRQAVKDSSKIVH
jgi:hypothetical protein